MQKLSGDSSKVLTASLSLQIRGPTFNPPLNVSCQCRLFDWLTVSTGRYVHLIGCLAVHRTEGRDLRHVVMRMMRMMMAVTGVMGLTGHGAEREVWHVTGGSESTGRSEVRGEDGPAVARVQAQVAVVPVRRGHDEGRMLRRGGVNVLLQVLQVVGVGGAAGTPCCNPRKEHNHCQRCCWRAMSCPEEENEEKEMRETADDGGENALLSSSLIFALNLVPILFLRCSVKF